MKKKQMMLDLIWNGILVVSVLWAVAWYYVPGHVDALGSTGITSFRYFTTDSNLLLAGASVLWMRTEWKMYRGEKVEIPKWQRILRYAATTAGALTLMEVLLFMTPMAFSRGGLHGALRCYEDNVFVLHFSAPLMMILSFLFTDAEYRPEKKETLWAMVPMLAYGTMYFTMVVVVKYWPDFYMFTFGGRYIFVPVMAAALIGATYVIATVLRKLKR